MPENESPPGSYRKLIELFKRLEVDDPKSWADSETKEGIPQLGRLLFLRSLWDIVLSYPEKLQPTAIEIARDICYRLDGPPPNTPKEVAIDWGVFLQVDGVATKVLSTLVESFDEAKPKRYVWGALTKVLTLRNATDATLGQDLEGLEQLDALWLGDSQISDRGIRQLTKQPSLTVLDLSGTKITDTCASELKKLPKLSALYLARTKITDRFLEALAEFPSLTTMNFEDTPVTDAGLDHLARLRSLTFILLTGTKVTPGGLTKLREKFPKAMVRFDAR